MPNFIIFSIYCHTHPARWRIRRNLTERTGATTPLVLGPEKGTDIIGPWNEIIIKSCICLSLLISQQGTVYTEVPPGAPQEPISADFNRSGSDSGDLRMRFDRQTMFVDDSCCKLLVWSSLKCFVQAGWGRVTSVSVKLQIRGGDIKERGCRGSHAVNGTES